MEQANKNRESLLSDNLITLMVKISMPAIVGMFVVGLYSFVDAIFVGQLINPAAVGAISIAYPFTLINTGIGALVGLGSASLLSRAIGEKDQKTIDKIMDNLLILVLILSSISLILGCIFTEELLSLTKVRGEVYDYAVRYLRIIFMGSLFVNFSQAANMVIRGEGKLTSAMLIMAFGAVLNILLTPLFIDTLGYGMEGAAIATVISQFAQCVVTAVYFVKFSVVVRFHTLRLSRSIIAPVMAVGFSAMIMQTMSLVQQTVLFSTLAPYGDEKVILMGAVMRYMMLAFIPVWGMSQAFQPVVGTNFGAKNYTRVRNATLVFSIGACILAVIFWGGFMLCTEKILSWFITDSQEIISEGLTDARIVMAVFPLTGILIIFLTVLQAVGEAKSAGMMVMLRQAILFIPLLFILPLIGGLGATGIFLTFAVTDVVVFVLALIILRKLFARLT